MWFKKKITDYLTSLSIWYVCQFPSTLFFILQQEVFVLYAISNSQPLTKEIKCFLFSEIRTSNCFNDRSIYVQIKDDKYGCAIVCNGVGKSFTTGSFRFDRTRRQIFHASPVNFAYYERVKWDVIQHDIRLVSRSVEHLRSIQFSAFLHHKMQARENALINKGASVSRLRFYLVTKFHCSTSFWRMLEAFFTARSRNYSFEDTVESRNVWRNVA